MRVVAGTERSSQSCQAELKRHLDALSRFIESHKDRPSPLCTLVLRSADSVPAQALALMKEALADAGMQAKAILAKLEPQDDFQQLFDTLSMLSPGADGAVLIRWARNPRLLDAHEQVTYGVDMCWTGDAMRRDAGKRNPLVVFESDAPESTHRARRAFDALWCASVAVPERRLEGQVPGKPCGAYGPLDKAPAPTKDTRIQGWPLVRH